jgi:hypothetical protein
MSGAEPVCCEQMYHAPKHVKLTVDGLVDAVELRLAVGNPA